MFVVNFLIQICYSIVVGIDLGSDTIKVAVGSRNESIRIFKDYYTNKFLPNIFAYHEEEKYVFGEDAIKICNEYPESCIRGFHFDNENYLQPISLKGYEIAAMAITQILLDLRIVEKVEEEDIEEVIFAIPPSLSIREKYFLKQAIELTSIIKNTKFVTTSYSPIEIYVNEKKNQSPNTKNAIFIDIGHQNVQIAGFEFNDTQIDQVYSNFNKTVGGEKIDQNLMNLITKKYSIKIENKEQKDSLMTQIKSARENLTRNSEALFDFNNNIIKITRDDVNASCEETREALKTMISILKQNYSNLLSSGEIQLLGGCSQIPYLKDYISQLLPTCKMSISINFLSYAAIGACYLSHDVIPSRIKVRNPLNMDEISLKIVKSESAILSNSQEKELNRVLSFENVNSSDVFAILDKRYNEDYINFGFNNGLVDRVLDKLKHNQIKVNISFDNCLLPVLKDASIIFKKGYKSLKIDFKNVGWETNSSDLSHSRDLFLSAYSNIYMNRYIKFMQSIREKASPINFLKYLQDL